MERSPTHWEKNLPARLSLLYRAISALMTRETSGLDFSKDWTGVVDITKHNHTMHQRETPSHYSWQDTVAREMHIYTHRYTDSSRAGFPPLPCRKTSTQGVRKVLLDSRWRQPHHITVNKCNFFLTCTQSR